MKEEERTTDNGQRTTVSLIGGERIEIGGQGDGDQGRRDQDGG